MEHFLDRVLMQPVHRWSDVVFDFEPRHHGKGLTGADGGIEEELIVLVHNILQAAKLNDRGTPCEVEVELKV
jgi:hypothetical protein